MDALPAASSPTLRLGPLWEPHRGESYSVTISWGAPFPQHHVPKAHHVAVGVGISFLLMAEQYPRIYPLTHQRTRVVCTCLATVTNTAMNMGVQVSVLSPCFQLFWDPD